MSEQQPQTPARDASSGRVWRLRCRVLAWFAWLMTLLYWDVLLDFLLHLLHIVIEYLELGLEGVLEALFHLEGHDAQMVTAWIGSLMLASLAGLLYILCLRRLKRRYRSSWGYFWLCLKDGAQHNWGFLSLLAMAYVGSLLLF